ncbi:hypothetical protein Fcan01_25615 [Folsomia candida]|uniref:Uncharacterized protein n=1 Tax=Folsomia candida TaxID=158441 RepID=A0A226D2R2_FOLCA|nr:hypothetical protein Fcan01_25615 [Folsomia candida]
MSFWTIIPYFVQILLQVTFGYPTIPRSYKYEASMTAKVTEYLLPFENCTTMIFTPNGVAMTYPTKPTFGPVILREYHGYITWSPEHVIFPKMAMQRRRNPAQHCWATFVILPEESGFSYLCSFTQFTKIEASFTMRE